MAFPGIHATGDTPSPPPYRGSAPDDALSLVRAGPQLPVAEGGGAGGEGGVLEEPALLQALLAQRPEVLPQVGHSAAVPPLARQHRPLLGQRLRHPRHGQHRPGTARLGTARHGASQPRLSSLPIPPLPLLSPAAPPAWLPSLCLDKLPLPVFSLLAAPCWSISASSAPCLRHPWLPYGHRCAWIQKRWYFPCKNLSVSIL